jgi:anti-anti-sigma regulatory factor
MHIRLCTDDAEAVSHLKEAVVSVLADRRRPARLSVELSGSGLPATVAAALVASLRRLREVGGAIALDPTTPEVRDALQLHALDRVFASVAR